MALLVVEDHYPAADQQDVPIDIAIEITFNQEVADSYLTDEFFRVYVLPDYQGQVNVNISKDGNKVILNPLQELPKNTMLEVLIVGDMNITDSAEYGIHSVNNDPMDKNYVFRFTTGESRNIDTGGGITPDPDTPYTIQIIKTTPPNNAFDVECVKSADYVSGQSYYFNIDVYFELAVDLNAALPLSEKLEIIRYPLINVADPYNLPHGYQIITDMVDGAGNPIISIDYHPDYNDPLLDNYHQAVRITVNDRSICNSDYIIRLLPNFVSYANSSGEFNLGSTYEFTYRTALYPLLTTIRAVRRRLGNAVSQISDRLIDEYILDASIDFICRFNNCQVAESMFHDYAVVDYITCVVAKALLSDIGRGYVGIVKQRTLGDLDIVYDLSGLRELLSDLQECADINSYAFDKRKIGHGVKSSMTYNYPGRRRSVFDI